MKLVRLHRNMFLLALLDLTKKRVGFNLKIFVFALLKTVQNRPSGMLDVFCDYLTAVTGVFSYGGRRPSQNVYLV